MATSTRDRISVDLKGLGPHLLDAARRSGRSPSDLVRGFLERGLRLGGDGNSARSAEPEAPRVDRSRMCLRMAPDERGALINAARQVRGDAGHLGGSARPRGRAFFDAFIASRMQRRAFAIGQKLAPSWGAAVSRQRSRGASVSRRTRWRRTQRPTASRGGVPSIATG